MKVAQGNELAVEGWDASLMMKLKIKGPKGL
jgi:hypothetical protein